MKIIGKFFLNFFGLILWILIMLLPYCLSVKIVDYIENKGA